jgi:hypothetical protein
MTHENPYLLPCIDVPLNGPVISILTNSLGIVITRVDLEGLVDCFISASTLQFHLKLRRPVSFGMPVATLNKCLVRLGKI